MKYLVAIVVGLIIPVSVVAMKLAPVVAQPVKEQEIGIAAEVLIKKFEGYVPCKYKDQAGVLTIGYGHTKTVNSLPNCIDSDVAEKLFQQDVRIHKLCVLKDSKVSLDQDQLGGLTSFTYNMGCGSFHNSTMLKKLNRKDYTGASEEFPKWKYITIKGVKEESTGLKLRRWAERTLYD